MSYENVSASINDDASGANLKALGITDKANAAAVERAVMEARNHKHKKDKDIDWRLKSPLSHETFTLVIPTTKAGEERVWGDYFDIKIEHLREAENDTRYEHDLRVA